MSTNDLAEPSIAYWPGDWPGRQIVDLDAVGDPGCWLEEIILDPVDLLYGNDSARDEALADDLADASITEAEEIPFPLPSDFGMEYEEMIEPLWRNFLGSSGSGGGGLAPDNQNRETAHDSRISFLGSKSYAWEGVPRSENVKIFFYRRSSLLSNSVVTP